MKTSGFREIDFSKMECKNCGMNGIANRGIVYYTEVGKVVKLLYPTKPYSIMPEIELIDCPVCKGTGYLNENGETELELDVFSDIRKKLDEIQPDQKNLQDILNKDV